jgi:hypothetical protein
MSLCREGEGEDNGEAVLLGGLDAFWKERL